MSDVTLIEKIKQDAAAEVAAIKAEGDAKVEAVRRETDAAMAARKEAHATALQKQLSQIELVAVSKAKQSAKIALQSAKREEINALFATVAEELATAPTAEYVAFFAAYAKTIVPAGITAVRATAPAARTAETAEILQQLGLTAEVVADTRLTAGLMITAADGVYDVTLTRLMNEKRAELEMEIVKQVAV